MLTLSEKAQKIPASPIRKLIPFADAAKKRGVKVYHLNIGQPDIASPKEALDAVKNADLKLVPYPHSAGNESYRIGLAGYYNKINIPVTANDIIITTGGSESVLMALQLCCNDDDEVIVMEPFYTNYNTFAMLSKVKMRPITTYIEDGFALPPISEFEKLIGPKTKAILVCNPGNPTGTLYPKEAMLQLGEMVKKHELYLISDEVYREFCYTDEPHFSCMHIPDLEENTVLVDSVSKRYSLCGVRIGAIVSRNKPLVNAALRFAQSRLCSPALGQIAAEGALSTPPSYFEAVRSEYIARRDLMVDALNKMPGVFCPKPMGAFYAVARLPIDDADKFAQWLLEEFEYNKQTVMITPAAGFYATPGKGKDEVRIAYVLNVDEMKAAMECLALALQKYPGRK